MKSKLFYWIPTGLLSAMMLMSAGMYFFNFDEVATIFKDLSYPTYIIYPLAILKILGVVALLTRKSEILKEWAYAGFFFDFSLAFAAHVSISDGEQFGAVIAFILLAVSFTADKLVFKEEKVLENA